MTRWLPVVLLLLFGQWVHSYPMDGYGDTGIRRLEQARLTQSGEIGGSKQPSGALLNTEQVDIRLGSLFTHEGKRLVDGGGLL